LGHTNPKLTARNELTKEIEITLKCDSISFTFQTYMNFTQNHIML